MTASLHSLGVAMTSRRQTLWWRDMFLLMPNLIY